jgi:hypothetical protein
MSKTDHSLAWLLDYLEPSVYYAEKVLEALPEENTHDQWRLFKLISEMRDIINNPPKV